MIFCWSVMTRFGYVYVYGTTGRDDQNTWRALAKSRVASTVNFYRPLAAHSMICIFCQGDLLSPINNPLLWVNQGWHGFISPGLLTGSILQNVVTMSCEETGQHSVRFPWELICILDTIGPVGETLQWRHNEHNSVSNHQPHDCLLNRVFGCRSKKTSKPLVTGLCVGNSPVTGEFPAQMASNAENVSTWWRHYEAYAIHLKHHRFRFRFRFTSFI